MDSPNRMAVELVDEAIDFADELDIDVHHLDNDAVVLDFGVDADGGIEAGLLLAEIQTAGLATVQTRVEDVAGAPLTYVELSTDHPLLALLCSQKAGWDFTDTGFAGRGSGPGRLFTRDGDAFEYYDRAADFDLLVLAIESADLPDAGVAEMIATRADLPTSGVYLPTAPVASIAGSVAMASRAAEVALHRLHHVGYNPTNVIAATGSAPVVPIAGTEKEAVARMNDALAYGSRVHLIVEEDADILKDLPFEATDYHGESFETILDGVEQFHHVEDAFAPAAATVDVRGGPTHVLGQVDDSVVRSRLDI